MPLPFGFPRSQRRRHPPPIEDGKLRVEHFYRKEDRKHGYVDLVDGTELFMHLKHLARDRENLDRQFQKDLEHRDRRHMQQLEKITSDYDKKLHHYHDKIRYLVRRSQVQQTEFLAESKLREQALWHVIHAQQKQLKTLARSSTDRPYYEVTPCDGSDKIKSAIFLAEFEFYLSAYDIPNNPRAQIYALYGHLTGEARDWLQPIIDVPHRYPRFVHNFPLLLAVFRETFCKDVMPMDHLSMDAQLDNPIRMP